MFFSSRERERETERRNAKSKDKTFKEVGMKVISISKKYEIEGIKQICDFLDYESDITFLESILRINNIKK